MCLAKKITGRENQQNMSQLQFILRDPDQPFVSKLSIIRESHISLKSVTFWEESNCIKICNRCPHVGAV